MKLERTCLCLANDAVVHRLLSLFLLSCEVCLKQLFLPFVAGQDDFMFISALEGAENCTFMLLFSM